MVFRSEHLWHFSRNICGSLIGTFAVRESEVSTLTRSARLTKVPQVITEEIGDKIQLILQTSKRDDLNAIWSGIGHLPTCQDNQEIWLPQGHLYLLFVVFLDESI